MADFIQVLSAEATLFSTRQSLVQADMALRNDVVALYTALGGGWESSADGFEAFMGEGNATSVVCTPVCYR